MNYLEPFRNINTFIFDVDGVMTNSDVLITEKGELLRKMSVRDGYAIRQAVNFGYNLAVITGGRSQGVEDRLRNLGILHIFSDVQDKFSVYEQYAYNQSIPKGKILYMGDDIPDYDIMRKVGVAACPNDAIPEILNIAQYVSPYKGGEGCVRDVIEKVLRLHGKWFKEPDLSQLH
ncbi:MAG: HAD hydrolase family protein [Bacteroidetes bacterium]|nr:HAD hydrolase family protein [Bacteroidota bacterium]